MTGDEELYEDLFPDYEAAKRAGMTHKVWRTVHDGKTRHDHRNADGQRRPIDQRFNVGGENLFLPGDPRGSAGNTLNCRCSVRYYRDVDPLTQLDDAATWGSEPPTPPPLPASRTNNEQQVDADDLVVGFDPADMANSPTLAADFPFGSLQSGSTSSAAPIVPRPPYPKTGVPLPATSPSGVPWPVQNPQISSGFGLRKQPAAGASIFHRALDFPARRGSPVFSTHDGIVISVRNNASSGNHFFIANDDGTMASYSHTRPSSRIISGVRVKAGEKIGEIDNSGIGSGAHLHYVLRAGTPSSPATFRSRRIDPLGHLFGFAPKSP